MRSLLLLPLLVACTACPGTKYPPPAQLETVDQALVKLEAGRARVKSYRAETVSDYWFKNKGKDQRVKGTVKMMGTPGAKAHFLAQDPMDNAMLDLVCDGTSFLLVDHPNNCILQGPCNSDSIQQLLRIALDPDDFFYLAIGQTPVLEGATGKVTWDGNRGYEIIELTAAGGSQKIVVDARDGHYDVMSSEMRGADGKLVWSVENKGFSELASADQPPVTLRVPGKSQFLSPGEHSDVIVEWNDRDLNATLPEQAFVIDPPPGIATCGAAPAPAAAPAP